MRPVRVVIIGGGTGGTILSNRLVKLLKDETRGGKVEIHLFTDSDSHYFQPANIDIAFRGAEPSRFVKGERELLEKEVILHTSGVELVKPDDRTVFYNGSALDYDYLVLSTGSRAQPSAVPGLAEASHNFHTGQEDSRRTWEALRRFERGRILVLVNIPHKCPPSPVEAVLLVEELMRKRGIRDKVEITFATPYPRAYPTHSIAEVVEPIFEERGIGLVTLFNTDYVDLQKKKVYSLEGEELSYDLLITVPPHRGAGVIMASGIGDEEGWIPTDKETLRVKRLDGVYALGDATNIPISKSGVVAHLQAEVAALNVASEIRGTGTICRYNGRINCPLELGDRRAIFVAGTYEKPPARQDPSLIKYLMKRAFSTLYWPMLRGRLDPLFELYLGKPYTTKG
jgi:sulfide:quinone oxidoreductase